MTEATTTISVRGEARHVVAPDFAVIAAAINLRDTEKQVALERAGQAQNAVLDALRRLGGTPLTAASIDAPLTWATRSVAAHRDEDWDEQKKLRVVGWRVHLPVTVTLRDLTRLTDVGAALTSADDLEVHGLRWKVNPGNPAWPTVRAAAIEDAITKARDYATALRGEVTALVHLADEGLLGGTDRSEPGVMRASSAGAVAQSDSGSPTLDPVPQEITAFIDARFEAQIAAL